LLSQEETDDWGESGSTAPFSEEREGESAAGGAATLKRLKNGLNRQKNSDNPGLRGARFRFASKRSGGGRHIVKALRTQRKRNATEERRSPFVNQNPGGVKKGEQLVGDRGETPSGFLKIG